MARYRKHQQQGAALIISLIILVAMTMLGITSMRGTQTEMAMAGNLRESSLTFQAAEAGLRSAESIVEDSDSPAMFDGSTPSMLDETDADPDYLDTETWEPATELNLSLSGITNNPKYIIKYLGGMVAKPIGPGEYWTGLRRPATWPRHLQLSGDHTR